MQMHCLFPLQFLIFEKVDKSKLLFTCRMSKRLRAIELSDLNFICFSAGDFGALGHFKGQ